MSSADLPRDWPAQVHPPGSERFTDTAMAWLLELVPPEYRHYGVLRRHPPALARLAREHVQASVEGARAGFRTARTELGAVMPPHAVEAVLEVYRREGARLVALARAVAAVELTLREPAAGTGGDTGDIGDIGDIGDTDDAGGGGGRHGGSGNGPVRHR